MTWTDSFNRADGPIGSDWLDIVPTTTIVSHHPYNDGGGVILVDATQPAHATASSVMEAPSATGAKTSVCVKANAAGTQFYHAHLSKGAPQVYIGIYKYSGGGSTTLYESDWFTDTGVPYNISLEYNSGTLTCRVDGTSRGTANDSDYSANDHSGLYNLGTREEVDSFTADSGPLNVYLTIAPSQVYAGNPLNYLSVTLNGAEWSSVDPPSTTLSVNHGWLVVGSLQSSTLATISWQSLGAVETITVTESEYGATGTFLSVSEPVSTNGDSWPLTEDGAGILNRTGDSCTDGTILTTCTKIDGEGTVNIPKALDAILEQLGGFYGQVGPDIGAVSLPEAIYRAINGKTDVGSAPYGDMYAEPLARTLRKLFDLWLLEGGPTTYTVQDVLDLLGGSPTLYSNADLNTALATGFSALDTAIDDAVTSIKGLGLPDLAALLTLLGTVQDDLATDVTNIRGDIAALDFATPASVAAVSSKLALIQPSETIDLDTLSGDLGGVADVTNATGALLTLVAGEGEVTLAMLLELLQALTAKTTEGPPVWPGIDYVDLGTAVPLADDLTINGALDGVIINITGYPVDPHSYNFGTVHSWTHVGAVMFVNDNGNYERAESFGIDSQILCPKTMAQAAGCIVRLNAGWQGTIQPWTISST